MTNDANASKPIASAETIRTFRVMALTGYIGLLLFMVLWQLFYTQTSELSLTFRLLFWVLPLLFATPGIIRGKPYTHAWANFILMWYFLHSLTLLWVATEAKYLAVAELVLTCIAFVGCTGYARTQGRAQGLGLKKLKDQT
ncbi:DUF2069 domain-containing protein [Pseudidiomarina sp. GXY010]|uniref:DUF2069 domain-containing protein n=1 Tax=Pseudidiomarina fusca TaxID=2965078 RepID=A0ABU3KT96_9GAMM|nr:DUF2069 domain-containing protein [Pseudidiomarina sp. GXY010]MDT7524709.1 DUF2069 domain-containing protein [Pseudidiomarina sp. GXY010]